MYNPSQVKTKDRAAANRPGLSDQSITLKTHSGDTVAIISYRRIRLRLQAYIAFKFLPELFAHPVSWLSARAPPMDQSHYEYLAT